jgi:hypothetical protein
MSELQEVNEERIKAIMLAITKAMNGIAEPEDWALICMECGLAFVPPTTH